MLLIIDKTDEKYITTGHNKGLLSEGQRGFSQVSFFYLTLCY